MARDRDTGIFAEPEIVDSPISFADYNPQILQNQFAAGQLGLPDYNNYNFGNFDLSAFSQPQYSEPVYSQPTAQPVQTAPYYGDYGNYDFGNFDLSAYQPQYSTPAPTYQSQPTPQPVQAVPYYEEPLVQEFVPPNRTYGYDPVEPASTYSPTSYSYDPYGIGSFDLSSYLQAGPTAAQLAARDLELTKPGVSNARWDPVANAFMYDMAPMKVTEPLKIQASSPPPPQSQPATAALPYTSGARTSMYSPDTDLNAMYMRPSYSDTTQQYLNQLDELAAKYKPAIGSFSSAVPTTSYTTEDFWGGNRTMPVYASEEELAPYLAKPVEQNLQYTFDVPSNKNKSTGGVSVGYNTPIALVNNATGEVVKAGVGFDAAQQIAEMARQLSTTEGKKAQWSIYTAPPGATDVNQFKPVATETKDKSFLGSVLSVVAPIAGTLLAGPLGLGALGLGSVGTGALGAALGSSALGVARGESLGDILKKAALSGAGAFAGGTLGNAIGIGSKGVQEAANTALQKAGEEGLKEGVSQTLGQTLGQAAAGGLDEIVVNAALKNALGSTLGSAAGAGLGSTALNSILNSMPAMQWKPDNLVDLGNGQSFDVDTGEIVVTGSKGAGTAIGTGGALGGGAGALISDALPGDIVVSGTRPPANTTTPETAAGAGAGALTNDIVVEGNRGSKVDTETAAGSTVGGLTGDIVVTADKAKLPSDTTKIVESLGAGLGGALAGTGGGGTGDGTGKGDGKGDSAGSTIGKVVGGLTIADALAKIIDKIAGGGGKGGVSPGGQQLQNVFSARLPRATGIFAPENLAPRDTSGIDYYRYGFGPEAAFFRNVPTSDAERTALVNAYRPSQLALSGTGGATSSASAVSDPAAMLNQLSAELMAAGISEADFNAYLQTPEGQQALLAMLGGTGFAKGGSTPMRHAKRAPSESFAVQGPGTGRSDEIPAVLSDGEYVIDAETVALLGDGSSKAGAKKLDQFRVNVRKHKGRNLAKGKFSVNAKRPEKYLSGGRT